MKLHDFTTAALIAKSCLLMLPVLLNDCHAREVSVTRLLGVNNTIPIKSWKTMRDAQVVKQEFDYSCGAASLATILRYYYGKSVSEKDVLQYMTEGISSFMDMASASKHFGFKGIGLSVTWDQLTKLKIPVIAHLSIDDRDHFSVIRGVDNDTVILADPSNGNRQYSKHRFITMWTDTNHNPGRGRILVLLPTNEHTKPINGFFTNHPHNISNIARMHIMLESFMNHR